MFHLIDQKTWPRREHFVYYSEKIRTSYQVNYDMDVTTLVTECKDRGLRFYPSMIFCIMKAVNHNSEFRMAINEQGQLGYYDICHPSYTIFHEDDHTFSDIWTTYSNYFPDFYHNAVEDMETYKDKKGIKAKENRPDAFTPISCVPWLHYSGISHDTPGPRQMYFPIITFGKYEKKGEKFILPFSLFVNHAVADGYHTSKLINEIESHTAHLF